jgi:hypothetical protein
MHFADNDLPLETSFFISHALILQRGDVTQPITLLMNQTYLESSP